MFSQPSWCEFPSELTTRSDQCTFGRCFPVTVINFSQLVPRARVGAGAGSTAEKTRVPDSR